MHDLWWLFYLDYILIGAIVVGAGIIGVVLYAIIQLWKHFKEK